MALKITPRTSFRRATRYQIQPGSRRVVMLNSSSKVTHVHHGELTDISATGIGFILPLSLAPQFNEQLSLEFEYSDGQKVNWVANVIRLETLPNNFTKVGAEFVNPPDKIREIIREAHNHNLKVLKKLHVWKWHFLIGLLGLVAFVAYKLQSLP